MSGVDEVPYDGGDATPSDGSDETSLNLPATPPAAVGPSTTARLDAVGVPVAEPQVGLGLVPEEAAAVDALPPGSALLIASSGPNSGARFLLDAETTSAGRDTHSEIFLDDVTVSRRHAEFRRGANGAFEVRDVGSLNGTYVNRNRIESVELRAGDEVLIGKYRLTYHPSRRQVVAP